MADLRKSMCKLADGRRDGKSTFYWLYTKKVTVMFGKLKKNKLFTKIEPTYLHWYPGNNPDANPDTSKTKSLKMPPLMVRKAPWRR